MIELKTPPLDIADVTHTGKVRPENQDRCASFVVPLGEVCLVADGMGGHQGGARAAELATLVIRTTLGDAGLAGAPVADTLRAAIQAANASIHAEAKSQPELANMGSTVVLALVQEGRVTIAHVGDSRAYLWRSTRPAAKLQRLTRDHNLMEPLIESGTLTEEQARHHYQSSVLTKALGPYPEVEPTISEPFLWEPGDRLLLCSDGLCGYVGDDRIEAALNAEPDSRRAADALFALAMDAGGEDNVTVQVIGDGRSVRSAAVSARSSTQPLIHQPSNPAAGQVTKASRLIWIGLAAATFLLLAGALAGWRFWQAKRTVPQNTVVIQADPSNGTNPPQPAPGATAPNPAAPPVSNPTVAGPAPAGVPGTKPSPASPAAPGPSGTNPTVAATPPAPTTPLRKPRVVLLCLPHCPVDGPAASVLKTIRADREIELEEIPLPRINGAGAPHEQAPFVLVRQPTAMPRATAWAAALGVNASGKPVGSWQDTYWQKHPASDILVLVEAN